MLTQRVVDLLEFLVKIGSFFFALMWCFFRTKSNNFISVICKNWFICLCEPFSGLNLCNFCKNPKEKEQNIKKKSALMLLFYQPATMAARLLHVKSENNYTLSLFFSYMFLRVHQRQIHALLPKGIIRQMFWAKNSRFVVLLLCTFLGPHFQQYK